MPKLFLFWILLVTSASCTDQLRQDVTSLGSSTSPRELNGLAAKNATSSGKILLTGSGERVREKITNNAVSRLDQQIYGESINYLTALEKTQPAVITAQSFADIRNINYAMILPTEESEQRAVFDSYKKIDLDVYRNIKRQVLEAKNGNVRIITRPSELIAWMKASKKKDFVIAGHNEKGFIRFPDGSKVAIHELENKVIGKEGNLLFLTCEGSFFAKNPAPSFKLTFREANSLATQYDGLMGSSIRGNKKILNEQLEKKLTKFGINKKVKGKIKIITVGAGVAEVARRFYSEDVDNSNRVIVSKSSKPIRR